jgi:hypothetical protein
MSSAISSSSGRVLCVGVEVGGAGGVGGVGGVGEVVEGDGVAAAVAGSAGTSWLSCSFLQSLQKMPFSLQSDFFGILPRSVSPYLAYQGVNIIITIFGDFLRKGVFRGSH